MSDAYEIAHDLGDMRPYYRRMEVRERYEKNVERIEKRVMKMAKRIAKKLKKRICHCNGRGLGCGMPAIKGCSYVDSNNGKIYSLCSVCFGFEEPISGREKELKEKNFLFINKQLKNRLKNKNYDKRSKYK